MFSQSSSGRIARAILSALLLSSVSLAQDDTYTDTATFEADILSQTNIYRVDHQSVAATYNDSMASAAAEWASMCNFTHPSLYEQGSNLAAGFDNPIDVVNAWYDEVYNPGYDFSTPGPQEGTLHFTQLVWNASTQIGCGAYYCNETNDVPGWYTVCYYYPEGNVVLYGDEGYYFERNVFPALNSTSTSTTSTASSTSSTSTTSTSSSTSTSATLTTTTSSSSSTSSKYTNGTVAAPTTITSIPSASQTVIHVNGGTTISVDGIVVGVDAGSPTHITILDGVLTGTAAEAAVASALDVSSIVSAVEAAAAAVDSTTVASGEIIAGTATTTTASGDSTSVSSGIIAATLTTTTASAAYCTDVPVHYVMLGQGIINLLVPASNSSLSARAFEA